MDKIQILRGHFREVYFSDEGSEILLSIVHCGKVSEHFISKEHLEALGDDVWSWFNVGILRGKIISY